MNVEEGATRMKRAGQWFMVPSVIALLIWVVGLTAGLAHGGLGVLMGPAMILTVIAIYLAIVGGALWLAAWIVEGFAKNPD